MCNGFRDTGRFSKLPYLGMKLSHWPKFQKMHIYTLSTPWGRNWAFYFAPEAAVTKIQDDFQNCHIWALNLPIGQNSRSCIYIILQTQGVEICAYFHSMHSGFRNMRRFSKLPNLGMKLGHWQKLKKLQLYSLSTPGVEFEHIFALRAAVSEIRPNFSKLPYLGIKLGYWPKSQKLHMYTLSTPGGSKLSLF